MRKKKRKALPQGWSQPQKNSKAKVCYFAVAPREKRPQGIGKARGSNRNATIRCVNYISIRHLPERHGVIDAEPGSFQEQPVLKSPPVLQLVLAI